MVSLTCRLRTELAAVASTHVSYVNVYTTAALFALICMLINCNCNCPACTDNAISVFELLSRGLKQSGDNEWLAKSEAGLLELSTHWQQFETTPGSGLADFSDTDQDFLECVPAYRGVVAGINAANAFMMREVAALLNKTAASKAAQLASLAKTVSTATIRSLYRPSEGFFSCITDGRDTAEEEEASTVGVPTVVDFVYVTNRGILQDLPPEMRDEMTRFVQTELLGAPWTGWMRALAKRPV
eukprot:COSAG06_NODE_15554_length_1062_cov_1.349948_1_plen_242_part_00